MFRKIKQGIPLFKNKEINNFISQNIDLSLTLNKSEFKKNIFSDDLFIIAQNTLLKDSNECIYESHKEYLDIHHIIENTEKMEVLTLKDIEEPYELNIEYDYYLYKTNIDIEEIIITKNQFIIFSFDDVHKVAIKSMDSSDNIIKIVIKIKKSLFEKEFINE